MQVRTKQTLLFYWKHVKRYKTLAAVLLLSLTAGVLLELAVPYFYKKFFDALTSGGNQELVTNKLVTLLLLILAFHGAAWVFWRLATFVNSFFQTRVMANLYNECFDYLHRHSYDFFTGNFAGSLVKQVNRFVRSFEGMADRICWDLLPTALKVVAIFAVLYWLHPLIGVVMLVWTIIFMALNYAFAVYKLKYDIRSSVAETKISGGLADTITNNGNIKLFSGLPYEFNRFMGLTEDWCKKSRFSWNLNNIAEAVQTFLMIFMEIAIFYFAILLWKKGILTVGDFVWIQAYLIDLFGRLWNFGRVVRQLYEYSANAEEMMEILDTPHKVRDLAKAKPIRIVGGKIEFKNVRFAYGKGNEVIDDLSFKIKSGEKVALIGPSGGGKSTVTKLLLRLFDIQKGQILIDGQDVKKVTQESLRSQISFVPQDPILFHRTLMENIRYGRRDAPDEEVMAAAKLAHCHEFIMKFPQKYKTYVGERGIKLSGGERQRVAIARAILANAPILILDEATSSLDSHSEAMIQEALLNLMKEKTTLIIAHRLSTIMRMDRIMALQNGRLVEEGTHADLVHQETSLYKKLWDLQVGGYLDR